MPRLILASGSPRRRSLIRALSAHVQILATDIDESVPAGTPPDVMVRDVALRKAISALVIEPEAVVIAADTTVALDGEWLAKPDGDHHAAAMLAGLQGREHQVFTGVAVATLGRILADVTLTTVTIAPLTDDEISAYVATGEGADKAGAYSIQGKAGDIVTGIDGCYTNVVGLPLCNVALLLARSGASIAAPPPPCGHAIAGTCPHPIWR